jgi:protein SCO1/2
MKPKFLLLILIIFTVFAMLGGLALNHRNHANAASAANLRTFQVHGQIRELDPVNRIVRIAHEEIPGFMPAMTMPLAVRDASLLANVRVGDSVQFELSVTDTDSWVSQLSTIKPEGAVTADAAAAAPATASDAGELHKGQIVPDFELIDQNGKPFRLSSLRGKAVVLTFIYTRCPLPDFCPLMSKNFKALQQRLEKGAPGKFQLVSVSIDPTFDRPEVLKEYASRYAANESSWSFATASQEEINAVASQFGLVHEPESGLISHNLRTALIGPDGRLVQLWKSNVWTPYEVQRRVLETLNEAKDIAKK